VELLRFRRFHETDLPVYAAWFADAELAGRAPFPDEEWLADATAGEGVVAEIASLDAGGDPVAVMRYEEDGDGGVSLFIAVDPTRRRTGIGRRVLAAFVERGADRFSHIDVYVQRDNPAGLALVRGGGFRLLGGADDEGYLPYRLILTA
jgi:ribosomal protein S18 acetylase RimI-like enzyme